MQPERSPYVKGVRDAAVAFATYARQAKDTVLVERATEVRFRAETKAGELLHQMIVDGKRATRQDNLKRGPRRGIETLRDKPTLDALGITNTQSKRWQKLAATKLAFPDIWEASLRKLCRMAVAVVEGNKAVIAAAKVEQHAEKKRERDKRERDLAEKIKALPDKKNGVVYVDHPWKFSTWSDKGKTNTSAENHYPTCDISEFLNFDIDRIAAANCALFMWATVPMLLAAIDVMTTWRFRYVSNFVWIKHKAGTGYWIGIATNFCSSACAEMCQHRQWARSSSR
jgi:MT-A70